MKKLKRKLYYAKYRYYDVFRKYADKRWQEAHEKGDLLDRMHWLGKATYYTGKCIECLKLMVND